jgi:diguanylate cyclase (GGDEF)-like protein
VGLVAGALCGVLVAAAGGLVIARALPAGAPRSTRETVAAMREAAAQLDHTEAVQSAYGIGAGIVNDLLALDAFGTGADPPALVHYAPGAAMTAQTVTRDQSVDRLTSLQSEFAAVADRLVVPDAHAEALAVSATPLGRDELEQLRRGPSDLDPEPYVDTLQWLEQEVADHRARAEEARTVIARATLTADDRSLTPFPLAVGCGLVAAALGLGVVMLAAARRARDLHAHAATDGLSHTANRRQLESDLDARGDERVGVLMIDIDHFKRLNDAAGHAAGDRAIQRVAGTVSTCLRNGDGLYRYGGEEFCVLLPGADEEAAAAVGERIRAAVEAVRFDGEEHLPGGRLTVSIGVAVGAPRDGVGRADGALYEAKDRGRNQVVASAATV